MHPLKKCLTFLPEQNTILVTFAYFPSLIFLRLFPSPIFLRHTSSTSSTSRSIVSSLSPLAKPSPRTMDAIGAAASLITLFTTCIQCFEYFQAARSFHESYDLLLVKLDVEKTKLLAWGDAMGILDPNNEDGVSKIRDIPIIERLLEKIKGLLDNANDLREKYGAKLESWEGSTQLRVEDNLRQGTALTLERIRGVKIVSRYSRFWKKFEGFSRPAPLVKFVWAIQDESRFETLIDELRGLVDGLNALSWIIPSVKVDEQYQKMREDIESIPSLPNLSNLMLVEAACSGRYSSWSEAVSQKIDASELGTRGRRDIEEWNQQIGDDEDGGNRKPKPTQVTNSSSYVSNGELLNQGSSHGG